ncbi:PEP-CTERM sorting domain-containing protein [Sphingomonas fennica]|uniref:PEP-CTERM sorting domain-containing protein n=1 Tax=Edaphosphingomonas fennica TaxID=114404 RepID=A0A2T4I5R4_9SPHN|nr:PEP-CTERM sorting domain-containing protein [Sphingomonas fennica]
MLTGTIISSAAFAAVPVTTDLDTWKSLAGPWLEDTEYGATGTSLSSVTLDGGVTLNFNHAVSVAAIGNGWATWSGGYTGDVLRNLGTSSVTATLADAVDGFGFFLEPNVFSNFLFTITTSDGTVVNQLIQGNSGAKFFGWNGPGITNFTISVASGAGGFAFGDFFLYRRDITNVPIVPEPASWALMIAGFGLMGAALRRARAERVTYALG